MNPMRHGMILQETPSISAMTPLHSSQMWWDHQLYMWGSMKFCQPETKKKQKQHIIP